MTISATDVKDLREKTGAGMMDCKKALAEAGGDVNVVVVEKGSEVGAHILSGAVIDPIGLDRLDQVALVGGDRIEAGPRAQDEAPARAQPSAPMAMP